MNLNLFLIVLETVKSKIKALISESCCALSERHNKKGKNIYLLLNGYMLRILALIHSQGQSPHNLRTS
jgi:hypothetical protein